MNTKAAHTFTPGEWHTGAGPSKYVFIPGNAKPINCGSIERARLIAAAPELYRALQRLVDYCEECNDDSTALFIARAALAKTVQS